MSNSILNWRFGSWHLHIDREPLRVRIFRNSYHDTMRIVDPNWRWFERY
jgi:hypothetical protein